MNLLDMILHIDQYLALWAQMMGPWLYVLVFLIVFAETGLVVTPFLPGDSLLFALGALTAIEGGLSLSALSVLLVLAAFIGDNTNYFFGKYLGPRVFKEKESKFFNKDHLHRTKMFYDHFGAKAVIIARFIPIVRTFVPFVAGVGQMNYKKYLFFSVFGAILWTQIFLWAGNIFGNIPAVKRNFHIVIVAVIIISVIPIIIGYFKTIRANKAKKHAASNL